MSVGVGLGLGVRHQSVRFAWRRGRALTLALALTLTLCRPSPNPAIPGQAKAAQLIHPFLSAVEDAEPQAWAGGERGMAEGHARGDGRGVWSGRGHSRQWHVRVRVMGSFSVRVQSQGLGWGVGLRSCAGISSGPTSARPAFTPTLTPALTPSLPQRVAPLSHQPTEP